MEKGEAASAKPVTGNGGGESGPKGVVEGGGAVAVSGPAAQGRDPGLWLRSGTVCGAPNPKSLIYQAGGREGRRAPSTAPPRKPPEPWWCGRGGKRGRRGSVRKGHCD
jgi:hypothetical protein